MEEFDCDLPIRQLDRRLAGDEARHHVATGDVPRTVAWPARYQALLAAAPGPTLRRLTELACAWIPPHGVRVEPRLGRDVVDVVLRHGDRQALVELAGAPRPSAVFGMLNTAAKKLQEESARGAA